MTCWNFKIENGIARLTLDTGKTGNRLSTTTFAELSDALNDLKASNIHGLILDAAGDDFSQGMDLAAFVSEEKFTTSSLQNTFAICNEALDRLYHLPMPTLSVIQGNCIGGGFLMALATDFRLAEKDAKFGFPEVKQSLVVNLGLKRVYQLLGEARTKELVLLGERVSANTLQNWGVINWVEQKHTLEEKIQLFKNKVASLPPLAVQANKELIGKLPEISKNESTELENALQMKVLQSSDFKEAIGSFLEKRKPLFLGK